MVYLEPCGRNTSRGLWHSICSQGSMLMDTAPSGSGPGAWLRNPGQLPGASKHKMLLENFTHGTPESQNSCDPVRVLVRNLCQASAREVPWVGPGRRAGPPKTKICFTSSHSTPGSQNSSGAVRVLVRSLCRVSARGVAWVSLGRPAWSVVGSHQR